MTNDLVKRLRDWSEYDEGKINDAREEAADRIEQLEAALDQLLDDMGEDGLCVCQQAKDEARAALGEKKDV